MLYFWNFFQYGDELGMTDLPKEFLPFNKSVDPQGLFYGPDGYYNHTRDVARTPMQWNTTENTVEI